MYTLINKGYAQINGGIKLFGEKIIDENGKEQFLTLLEIEELKKQGQIIDPPLRKIPYLTVICIEKEVEVKANGNIIRNKCKYPTSIPQRYVNQLEYMGYDISKLEYKLKGDM